MSVTNVSSAWVSGNLVFYDKDGAVICTYDGTNRKVSFPSGSTLESLGTLTVADTTLSPNDLAVAEGSILVGDSAGKAVALSAKTTTAVLIGNGTTITSAALSGDVKMDNAGATTIQAKAVENTMIAAAAGTVLIGTKTSGDVTALDNSAEGAVVIGQGAGETCAAAALSGDVKMDKAGATTIQAVSVESTMIALAAGTIAVGTKTSGDVTALDASAEGAIAIGQGAGETMAAAALSGDVKMDKTGATTIQAVSVESTMIALAAGTIAVGTKTSGDVTALDISAEGAMALGQGAGETAAAYAMSGDVTMTKGGVTAIGAKKVTSSMVADTVIHVDTVSISKTEILTATTIKTLVAAPATGYYLDFISATLTFKYDTAAYTAGGNLTVGWVGGAALTGLVSNANSFGAAADNIYGFVPLSTVAYAITKETALGLQTSVQFTDPGTAAGTAECTIAYRILPIEA